MTYQFDIKNFFVMLMHCITCPWICFRCQDKTLAEFSTLEVAVCHALNCAVYQIRTNLALKIMPTQLKDSLPLGLRSQHCLWFLPEAEPMQVGGF
jgi:hypothetical protein